MFTALITKHPVTELCPLMLYSNLPYLGYLIGKVEYCHFLVAKEYRQRVIQMGEHSVRVFLVGGLRFEAIKRLKLLTR